MERDRVPGVVVAGFAALLVIIGSVTPWVSLSTPFGSIGLDGTNHHLGISTVNGTYTLVLALVAGALFGLSLLRPEPVFPSLGVMLACVTAGIAVWNLIDVGYNVTKADSTPIGSISIGWGLWILAVAGIAMVVGSFMTLRAAQTLGSGSSARRTRPVVRPTGETDAQEYWATDPFGRHERRWWDGNKFTDKVMDGDVESTDPPGRLTPKYGG